MSAWEYREESVELRVPGDHPLLPALLKEVEWYRVRRDQELGEKLFSRAGVAVDEKSRSV